MLEYYNDGAMPKRPKQHRKVGLRLPDLHRELGKAGVHWNTVSAIELGKSGGRPETLKAIQRALERGGVEFTNGKRPGVLRMK